MYWVPAVNSSGVDGLVECCERRVFGFDGFEYRYPAGRNGMLRQNIPEQSMLTAKLAVNATLDGRLHEAVIWTVNVDDYNEAESTCCG